MNVHLLLLTLVFTAALSTVPQYGWYDAGQAGKINGDDDIVLPLTSGASSISAAGGGSHGDVSDGESFSNNGALAHILGSSIDDDGLLLDVLGSSSKNDLFRERDDQDSQPTSTSSTGTHAPSAVEELIEDILSGQFTPELDNTAYSKSTGTSTTITESSDSDSDSSMIQAYKQFQAAAEVYAYAQSQAKDTEEALTEARAAVSSAEDDVDAEVSASVRANAAKHIAVARAQARASVTEARQEYVATLAKTHAKISVMRLIEKRLHTLAVAFKKVRAYTGTSILGVKKCARDLALAKIRTPYRIDDAEDAYSTAVNTAKARVSKMKVIESRFLAVAKAFAKARAEAKVLVRAVRKCGYHCATACAKAGAQVSAAVAKAEASVTTALGTIRAVAVAKASALATAAEEDMDQAQQSLHAAALSVAKAKAQVMAVITNQPAAGSAGSVSGTEAEHEDDDDDDTLNSYNPPLTVAQADATATAAVKSSIASTAGTDATDTKAYY